MICLARIFGALLTVPVGNVTRIRSQDVMFATVFAFCRIQIKIRLIQSFGN
jgi:hypothetical protein